MNILRENQASFACVIDENGGIEGVITIKDVLSEFVGELLTNMTKDLKALKGWGPGNGLLKVEQI